MAEDLGVILDQKQLSNLKSRLNYLFSYTKPEKNLFDNSAIFRHIGHIGQNGRIGQNGQV